MSPSPAAGAGQSSASATFTTNSFVTSPSDGKRAYTRSEPLQIAAIFPGPYTSSIITPVPDFVLTCLDRQSRARFGIDERSAPEKVDMDASFRLRANG